MNFFFLNVFSFCILFPFFCVLKVKDHFLKVLLMFELIILFIMVFFGNWSMEIDSIFFFILLTISACEASLGLSCLVLMLRGEGNDFIMMVDLMKC